MDDLDFTSDDLPSYRPRRATGEDVPGGVASATIGLAVGGIAAFLSPCIWIAALPASAAAFAICVWAMFRYRLSGTICLMFLLSLLGMVGSGVAAYSVQYALHQETLETKRELDRLNAEWDSRHPKR